MKKKTKITKIDILAVLSVCSLLFILLIPSQKYTKSSPVNLAAHQTNPLPSTQRMAELELFWTNHLHVPLTQTLYYGLYNIQDIQERYIFLSQKINSRYGRELVFNVVMTYLPQSRYVPMASGVDKGTPTVYVFLPSVIDNDKSGREEGLTAEDLELGSVVGLIHEMDHLAFGFVQEERDGYVSTLDELVNDEKRAWAETCEHTLRPLVEKQKKKFSSGTLMYLQAWNKCGRNAHSQLWDEFIRVCYGETRK